MVAEVSPRTREWVFLVDSWVSTSWTSVRISNVDLDLGVMPDAMSTMMSAGTSIPAVVGMPSATAAMGMVKRW